MLEDEIAEIHIGALGYERNENILAPFYPCVIITATGAVWDIQACAFTCSPQRLANLWNTERKYFTKRMPA